MPKSRQSRLSLPLYVIPILIGFSGILLSRQFPNTVVRSLIVLLSVSAPLFTLGNAVARLRIERGRWRMAILGAFMLIAGGVVMLWDLAAGSEELTGFFTPWGEVSDRVWELSRWIGTAGLLVGMVVLLYIVVRREEEVGELVRRFSSLAEQMGEGFLVTDTKGDIILANRSLLDMTGLHEQDILGRDIGSIAGKQELRSMFSMLDQRRQGKATEYTLAWDRNGVERHFWVSGTPIFGPRGGFAGALATFRDITELHQLSQRLEQYTQDLEKLVEDRTYKLLRSEERVRELLKTMSEGFLTVDEHFTIHFANDRMHALLRAEEGKLPGEDLLAYVSPAHCGRLHELVQTAHLPEEERLRPEVALVRKDGQPVTVVIAVAPITLAEADSARYSLVVTDVREFKRMQREMEERAAQLEAVNEELRMLGRAKDGFLTNVSHELRTPLSTIRGYVEMLESGALGKLDDVQANALRVMYRNVDRLGFLIEEMLEFSRLQIRGIELMRTLVRVEQLMQECAHSAHPQLEAKGMSLHAEVSEGLPSAWLDRKRIGQILQILLSNAIKFSHPGGTITCRASERENATLALSVCDQGIGIDKVHMKQVFEKFYQVDGSLARRYEGAGIGLSIAKSITEAHGGHIELESELGKGSVFTIVLPNALFSAPAVQPIQTASTRILLVDHIDESADALRNALEAAGCGVTMAASTFAAVRFLSERSFDATFLADTMPDLPCASAVVKMRETAEETQMLLLVSVDEHISGEEAARLNALGARLLRRPFTAEQLARAIFQTYDVLEPMESEEISRNGMEEAASVLVVESDPDMREWLETALTLRGMHCLAASDITHAAQLAKEACLRAVFLDTDPPESSISVLREALGGLSCPIFVLTGLEEGIKKYEDAHGVLVKPFRIQDALSLLSTLESPAAN